MRFNASKSTHTFFPHKEELHSHRHPDLEIGGKKLTHVNGFVYLGLPVGNCEFAHKFVDDKLEKCVRAFYSLNYFGCRSGGLTPQLTAFMYRTYCQPILSYCLEAVEIGVTALHAYDSRQATLVKRFAGVSKYARSIPLLNALKIASVSHLYHKMKLVYLNQLQGNQLTNSILGHLRNMYQAVGAPKQSVVRQLNKTAVLIGVDIFTHELKYCLHTLNNNFSYDDDELVRKTYNLCTLIGDDPHNSAFYRQILKEVLSCNDTGALR